MNNIQAADVLARLKVVYSVKSDTDLARALDTSAQTISSWKSRDRIPYAVCVETAWARGISLDWLICGRGSMTLYSSQTHASVREETGGEYDGRERLMLDLFRSLSETQQQEFLQIAQEKRHLLQMQNQIEQLQAEIETLKNLD